MIFAFIWQTPNAQILQGLQTWWWCATMYNTSHAGCVKGHNCEDVITMALFLCAQVRNRIKRRCKMWRMKPNETTPPIWDSTPLPLPFPRPHSQREPPSPTLWVARNRLMPPVFSPFVWFLILFCFIRHYIEIKYTTHETNFNYDFWMVRT